MSRVSPLALLGLLGCEQAMRDQPRVDPLADSPLFADGRSARELPPGVVPRGQARLDLPLWTGRAADDSFVARYPFPIAAADLRRGEQRFAIHCLPCHGRLGLGDGMIVRRGYPAPPPYSAPRVRDLPPAELFEVVTHGRGAMPDYDNVEVTDRWRIVAWVEVLRLSQRAPISMLSPEEAPP
jgi:mono/diheme cytochrome c family protein